MAVVFQAKLPFVLRTYRDTLTADMKTAIKTAVAELLPVLVGQPLESDMGAERTVDADGKNYLYNKSSLCVFPHGLCKII